MGQAEKDRAGLGGTVRTKPKEQTLIRRRKVSVPELGPMTTVQEIAMDSPTIPGRPPLHERSISAPGNSWRQHVFGESMLSCISGPALDENAEMDTSETARLLGSEGSSQNIEPKQGSGSQKQPLSPKVLAPLLIPASLAPLPQRLVRQRSVSRLRSGSSPPDVPPKSARMKEGSPYGRSSPFTPLSASNNSIPTSTAPTSVSSTPSSAFEGRSSPQPWSAGPSPNPGSLGHSIGQSETTHRQGKTMGHRRGESEASIMDRGRPAKRVDGIPIKRMPSKRTVSASEEKKAFETLPLGHRPREASSFLPATEIETLRKQAMGQASRFEVLCSKDVENLSRELRGLDERCEYLRKTHRSLRSGRRNLHARICTYLRSPRVARFSHESILKQEEALSELDTSIDSWVSKLEQAENRRTRVRQKLLEHVAAALILPATPADDTKESSVVVERSLVTGPTGENTPPRSPTKSQSPQRLAAPVLVDSPEQVGRASAESIRIYADSDVYALLADVEEEINRMGDPAHVHTQVQAQSESGHEAAINAGMMLNAATFSPPKPVGYGTTSYYEL
ncbi:hypothetical protein D0Z07_1252 [Hyphodiscus hymeniophilus]|uniref:Up-regulated during septation protein 1 domain-containing protein n=1 Tax=Hyphodiscus hymeniophilus TaxID=353542 RepID=A0A9P6VPQ5_9HELO|nr:hypothetical protein D0Z07_1252 [Hyphodiscus hymeniophilus]